MELKTVLSFLLRPLKIVNPIINKSIEVVLRKNVSSTKFIIDNNNGLNKLLRENVAIKINLIHFKSEILISKDSKIINIDFKDCINQQSSQFKDILKSRQDEIKEEVLNKFLNNKK